MAALAEGGFVEPTPIQQKCLPPLLEGHDLIGVAQTGTGKTLAFLVPIFQNLKPTGNPQALVVCPTRELAQQVGGVASTLGASLGVHSVTLYGGTGLGPQRQALEKAPDVIVGTPGRLLDFLSSAWLRPRFLKWLVLDEADRMLDMGFIDDVTKICSRVPASRQTMLFSATMPPPIVELSDRFLYEPVTVRVERKRALAAGIAHEILEVSQRDKERALCKLMRINRAKKVLVFTATREATGEMASRLRREGHEVVSLSSLLSQANRERALAGFRDGDYNVMVATDVAARGIDVVDIDLVINFDLPTIAEDYVHRVGRTGRAERKGSAISLVAPDDRRKVEAIECLIGEPLPRATLVGFDKPAASEGRRRERSNSRGGRRTRSGGESSSKRGGPRPKKSGGKKGRPSQESKSRRGGRRTEAGESNRRAKKRNFSE